MDDKGPPHGVILQTNRERLPKLVSDCPLPVSQMIGLLIPASGGRDLERDFLSPSLSVQLIAPTAGLQQRNSLGV